MKRILSKFSASRVVLPLFGVALASLLLAESAQAASVFNCASTGKKCTIKMEAGLVGDSVKVLDEKAHIVGYGYIVKRKGSFGVISLTQVTKEIHKGYPVIVNIENRSSNLQWAASFSEQE